jgi:hypothetical protein
MGVTLVPNIEGRTRMRVLESRVLRSIFGTERNTVTESRRTLHNEELRKFVLFAK